MEPLSAKDIALRAIIRAEHDGNCGLSNCEAHLRDIREAIISNPLDIKKALEAIQKATNSLRYARKSMEDLYKTELYINSLV